MALKEAYAGTWTLSSEREAALAASFTRTTGIVLEQSGIGAGSQFWVSGSSESRGGTKGEADYRSADGRLAIEVTGPLRARSAVRADAAIWVRPDKLAAAEAALAAGQLVVVAHNLPAGQRPGDGLWRFLVLDADACARWRAGAWGTIVARPYGLAETYLEISASDPCVLGWDAGCARLRTAYAPRKPSPWMQPRRFALVAPAPKPPALPPVVRPAAVPVRAAVPGRIPGLGLARGAFGFRAVKRAA